MGNDLKTAAGYIATTGTLVAAGVTFGQVKCINKAVEDCAEFTAENAKKKLDTKFESRDKKLRRKTILPEKLSTEE